MPQMTTVPEHQDWEALARSQKKNAPQPTTTGSTPTSRKLDTSMPSKKRNRLSSKLTTRLVKT